MRLHLNIGTNSGDRHARLREAIAAVSVCFASIGGRVTLSAPLRSEPWGYVSANEFLNIGVRVDMGGQPSLERIQGLFEQLMDIERAISPAPHRNADGSYRDRDIDIDLIAVQGFRVSTPGLELPHPRARLRNFVMEPLRALDPETADGI